MSCCAAPARSLAATRWARCTSRGHREPASPSRVSLASLSASASGLRPSQVYLDWNATTPPLAEVVAAMAGAARTAWGNPSSVHGVGRVARDLVGDQPLHRER